MNNLELLIKKAFAETDKFITFGFQGGEPLLAGYDFFRNFFYFIEKYNKDNIKYEVTVQSNGLLITEEFVKLFKENNVLMGISLDGNRALHDTYRLDFQNKGTFDKVMDNIKLLKQSGIEFNILSVVTKDTSKKIKNLYSYFKQMNFNYLQFTECLDRDLTQGQLEKFSLTPKDHYIFLDRLFQMWYRDLLEGKYISIRNFDLIMQKIIGNWHLIPCYAKGICTCQNIVEADGSFYTCDFYATERNNIGNIQDQKIEEIISSPRIEEFIEESRAVPEECSTCPVYDLCRNGCKRYRVEGKYYYCESTKKFLMQRRKDFVKAIKLIGNIT